MSVSLAGQAPASFELKSAHLPLLALLLKSPDVRQLARELAERYGDQPHFFDHDPVLLDLQPLSPEALPDFDAIRAVLGVHRLRPLAVRGGTAAQRAAALSAGLFAADDAIVQRAQPPAGAAAAPLPAPEVAPVVPPGALVIDKPLRSGQQVYARGRDLVVLARVNPGAEVIADGHIHVHAALRGKAMAGARGNTEARIFALAMAPELISIAGIYRTSEVPLPASLLHQPAQVRLQTGPGGDRLVFETLPT